MIKVVLLTFSSVIFRFRFHGFSPHNWEIYRRYTLGFRLLPWTAWSLTLPFLVSPGNAS